MSATADAPVLYALDADLPLLASRAATELDNLLLGKSGDLGAVKSLGELLHNSFQTGTTVNSRPALDSATMSLVGDALNAANWTTPATTEEVITQATMIAGTLRSVASPSKQVESMRSFCAALASCAASYLQSVYELGKAPHPYRR